MTREQVEQKRAELLEAFREATFQVERIRGALVLVEEVLTAEQQSNGAAPE